MNLFPSLNEKIELTSRISRGIVDRVLHVERSGGYRFAWKRRLKHCSFDYLKRETIRHTYTHEITYLSPSNVTACVCLAWTLARTADLYSVYAYLVISVVALPSNAARGRI